MHRPQGEGEDGLQHAAGEGQQAGRERLAEGGGRRGGEDDQRDQGDAADIAGRRTRGHQQSGGKRAHGFQHDGDQVVASAEASRENRQGDKQGGAEHAAAAVQVRVVAIREGDIERAGGSHRATGRIAQGDADDERDRHAQRVAQGHHRCKPRAVELR